MSKPAPSFKISLAEWSFHRALQAGEMDNLDFPLIAKQRFRHRLRRIREQFFKDKAKDANYLRELKQRCDDNGVRSGLIMCDHEGDLGDPDDAKPHRSRSRTITNGSKRQSSSAAIRSA